MKYFRNAIPIVLLLVLSITLSGCTKEVKDSFDQGKQEAQEQIQQQKNNRQLMNNHSKKRKNLKQ